MGFKIYTLAIYVFFNYYYYFVITLSYLTFQLETCENLYWNIQIKPIGL